MKQHTIQKEITIEGVSPYSGESSKVTIKPAAVDTGIAFLFKGKCIPVSVSYLPKHNELHTTALSLNNIKIETVEHLLSAIAGLGISNATIDVAGDGQIPVISGTANDYARPLLLEAGLVIQDKEQPVYKVEKEMCYEEGDSFAVFEPWTLGRYLEIEMDIKFPSPIGVQCLIYKRDPRSYISELGWARSFLRSSLDTVHILNGKEISSWDAARRVIKTLPENPKDSPILCYSNNKYVVEPKKPDEAIRHKMMDFIGDFSIVGRPVHGRLKIHWPGHAFNCNLARWFVEETLKD